MRSHAFLLLSLSVFPFAHTLFRPEPDTSGVWQFVEMKGDKNFKNACDGP
jgi:hypothetical protein